MRTNPLSFVLNSENRRCIVQALLATPQRPWSCTSIEEVTHISHATVFRTLKELVNWGILKSFKVNKKDIIYEVVLNSLWTIELQKMLDIEKLTARKIALLFINKVKPLISASLLYGSSIEGKMTSQSDIDILIVVDKHTQDTTIYDHASFISAKVNRTIALAIMDRLEILKEKNNPFLKSVQRKHVVLYGKTPL